MLRTLSVLAVVVVCQPNAMPLGEPAPAGQEMPGNHAGPEEQQLGRFHAGRFYLTPVLRIGWAALDTNVFYSPTGRSTDVTASAGWGLDRVLPGVGGASGRLRGSPWTCSGST